MAEEQEQETSFRDLKLPEIKQLIDSGDYDVVDVREGWERTKGHIPGSRHAVLAAILANPQAHQFKPHTIFVCEVGERSAVASEMAVALGVEDVVNFRGGHQAWREAGLPMEEGL
jgi:rhodanese-related sulfurtransferase